MVGVVSSIPTGATLFVADFETDLCQFCTKMPEISDWYYLGKTQMSRALKWVPYLWLQGDGSIVSRAVVNSGAI